MPLKDAADPGSEPWREATAPESALLAAAVSGDWEGASELRAQLPGLLARAGCSCGCGSIDLRPRQDTPASTARSPAPCEGAVLDATGEEVGGLLLWLDDGFLDHLEVYSWGDRLSLPALDRVRWKIAER